MSSYLKFASPVKLNHVDFQICVIAAHPTYLLTWSKIGIFATINKVNNGHFLFAHFKGLLGYIFRIRNS